MRKKNQERDKPQYSVMLSQSFINDALDRDACPVHLKYKYIEKIEEEEQEDTKNVMFRGRYFEWHLLGATRDGQEPKFIPNTIPRKGPYGKKDYRPQAQIDMDRIILEAMEVLKSLGLDPEQGEKQKQVVSEDYIGHLDWVTRDIVNPERRAIYDVKYTETAEDDRFRGWADFDSKPESKLQAIHYIILMYLETGEYMPFYFLIFGKSGWVKVIKVELTSEGLNWHEQAVKRTREKVAVWDANFWKARPSFNKCNACGYGNFCKHREHKPEIEIFRL